MNRYKKSGWWGESHRHSLSAKGIKNKISYSRNDSTYPEWEGKTDYAKFRMDNDFFIQDLRGGAGSLKSYNYYVNGLKLKSKADVYKAIKLKLSNIVREDKISKKIEKFNFKELRFIDYSEQSDMIHGGLSDNSSDSDFDKKQIKKGIKVELEHTDNPKIAKEISQDHLSENKNYYTYLEKMEKQMKKDSKKKDVDYQQDVYYGPITVELPESEEHIVVDIGDTEARRKREQKIREAGIKTRKALVAGARGLGRGIKKVGGGLLSTIATGLFSELEEKEPRRTYPPSSRKNISGYEIVKFEEIK